jgi:hypothetical protein
VYFSNMVCVPLLPAYTFPTRLSFLSSTSALSLSLAQ